MRKIFAKPQIVESPFDKNRLAIAYPYTENGKWLHKDELKKEYFDKQKIKDAIIKAKKYLSKLSCVEPAYDVLEIIEKELGLDL